MPTKERVHFPGDPIPRETGTGAAPTIPLNQAVQGTTVEMIDNDNAPEEQAAAVPRRRVTGKPGKLSFEKDEAPAEEAEEEKDDFEDDGVDEEAPTYARESIGARIGQSMEETKGVSEVIETLDSDDVVPLLFPKKVSLQDKGLMHHWEPGVHLVPVSIAGETPKGMHWWLKDNRVRRAGKRMSNPNKAA
jgi:hypothetical protein